MLGSTENDPRGTVPVRVGVARRARTSEAADLRRSYDAAGSGVATPTTRQSLTDHLYGSGGWAAPAQGSPC